MVHSNTDYNNKYVYMTSGGFVFKKKVVSEGSVSEKLNRLRSQVEMYAKYKLNTLETKNLEPEKIQEISREWIDSIVRHYEINCGESLDSVITYFDFKISRIEQDKKLVKVK